ncbi:hypothetical protein MANES_11G094980v8 [Manihot esculenta]|uniref:Uncharacterized protein n=1 Tax=Manihot esculenta TaxID=3983 RepID=A0ACB7GV10_MANES|nr:hypothetical protein MANES_11G094980v8 [Manihot esculenta]
MISFTTLKAREPSVPYASLVYIYVLKDLVNIPQPSIQVPVLYFFLLSLDVTISLANPLNSNLEVTHQIQLCKPKIAFATSQTARKLPYLPLGIILIDSIEFLSLLT